MWIRLKALNDEPEELMGEYLDGPCQVGGKVPPARTAAVQKAERQHCATGGRWTMTVNGEKTENEKEIDGKAKRQNMCFLLQSIWKSLTEKRIFLFFDWINF